MTRLPIVLAAILSTSAHADAAMHCYKMSKQVGAIHQLQQSGMTHAEWSAELVDKLANGDIGVQAAQAAQIAWEWTATQDASLSVSMVKYNWQQQVCRGME